MKKIAIIGGGAAGLMVGATLVESGVEMEVHLFERNNHLGAKVIISGGGRCNVTTGVVERKELLSKYTRGGDFVKKAIGGFSPKKVWEWFESHGVKMKMEDDLRAFPVSDNGRDVVGVFERIFREAKINVRLKETVLDVFPVKPGGEDGKNENGNVVGKSEDENGEGKRDGRVIKVVTDKGKEEFDYVVLTTGGNAYRHTGSQGDGYRFAQNFDHSVTRLGPSLNSFLVNEDWAKSLSGISLENVRLEAVNGDGDLVSARGPMLFTHFGISGPAVFALSSHLAFTKISVHHPLKIGISVDSGVDFKKWDQVMIDYFNENGARQIRSFLKGYFPTRFADVVLELAGIVKDKKNSEISKDERVKLAKLLSGELKVTTVQRRPGDEFVTAGGVELGEVDAKTMRSKLHPGVFFAGEILDVDGVTGGFNLQASWAMGRLAGKSIAGECKKE